MQAILEGVRVLDFGRYIAGPFCAALLADFGADVIRIEKRDGSEDRFVMPVSSTGDGSMFMQMNRNKRSMTLDPMSEQGREIVRRLVARADVVVANLPAPTLAAMALDYASLSAVKPEIILTSVSAFGPSGPYRDRVGFDGIGQAMSGAIFMSGFPDQPMRSMTSFVDFTTALSCAYGTALALLERSRTGKGQLVEASLLRSALNLTNSYTLEQDAIGIDRVATGNRGQTSAPADLFRTTDGWILVQVVGGPLFNRVIRLLDAPEWREDPRFATDATRGDHGKIVSERMQGWCALRTSSEALAELESARIPSGPVYSPQQALDDPHVREAGLFERVEYPGMERAAPVAKTPVTIASNPTTLRRAPLLGEHTNSILRDLGYGQSDIEAFEANGVI